MADRMEAERSRLSQFEGPAGTTDQASITCNWFGDRNDVHTFVNFHCLSLSCNQAVYAECNSLEAVECTIRAFSGRGIRLRCQNYVSLYDIIGAIKLSFQRRHNREKAKSAVLSVINTQPSYRRKDGACIASACPCSCCCLWSFVGSNAWSLLTLWYSISFSFDF